VAAVRQRCGGGAAAVTRRGRCGGDGVEEVASVRCPPVAQQRRDDDAAVMARRSPVCALCRGNWRSCRPPPQTPPPPTVLSSPLGATTGDVGGAPTAVAPAAAPAATAPSAAAAPAVAPAATRHWLRAGGWAVTPSAAESCGGIGHVARQRGRQDSRGHLPTRAARCQAAGRAPRPPAPIL